MASLFVLLQRMVPKRLLSDLVGRLTRVRGGAATRAAIRWFIRAYRVDLGDAEVRNVDEFVDFNAFFTRALRAGTRPQPTDPNAVSSPADGTISEQGEIETDTLLQAKGVAYRLQDLFDGDQDLAERFHGGSFQTIYLAPYNYHRVHMPLAGRATHLRYVPGALFSVNAATVRALPGLFCRNERVAVVFECATASFAVVMVGALNVGSIELTLPADGVFRNRPRTTLTAGITHALGGPELARGAEFGRFNMGSTVIVVASAGCLAWDPTVQAGDRVKVGQAMGRRL